MVELNPLVAMATNFNLKAYKEAIVICIHLEAILKVVNLSINGLKHFRPYIPVSKILKVLEEQKIVLEVQYKKYEKIKKTKGKETN